MKKITLILVSFIVSVSLYSQKETVAGNTTISKSESIVTMADNSDIKIFPIPVKENNFSVTSKKEISLIRVTNIIGQEISRNKYPPSVLSTQIYLNNPQRGMYLVTISFSDGSRIVRKILIEPL